MTSNIKINFQTKLAKVTRMTNGFKATFPAVRGTQAGRPCYIAMCPLRIIPTIFKFDEEDVPAELRAQRKLNITRIPEITNYLLDNPRDYTLSALTASINGRVEFSPYSDTGIAMNLGTLTIPLDAQILINDGQHRRAAIESAIKDNPELGYDNIPVLFFIDEGLERSQQMFADLNKHAIRPSDSISTLYDHRDLESTIARYMVKNVKIFKRMTEMEKSSISNRSNKLFTLSAIKNATKSLLKIRKDHAISEIDKEIAVIYWEAIAAAMPDWVLASEKKITTSELRENYIHSHGVMLQALGYIGSFLISKPQTKWNEVIRRIEDIDWSRSNPEWSGRAIINGRISKSNTSVILTAVYIKKKIGMPLTASEVAQEEGYQSGR